MGGDCGVCMGEERNVLKILVGKIERQKSTLRQRCRWEDNIKMYVKHYWEAYSVLIWFRIDDTVIGGHCFNQTVESGKEIIVRVEQLKIYKEEVWNTQSNADIVSTDIVSHSLNACENSQQKALVFQYFDLQPH